MALRETDPAAVREALVKVNQSALRTSRLAQQLLSHARATEAHVQAFAELNLVQLARESIEVLLPQAVAKTIDLGFEGDRQAMLWGDRALIGELILNLADNAIKYSPADSMVTLTVRAKDRAIHLIVEDDGPGIAAEGRAAAFERFSRLHNAADHGCGLGLAIVREIAGRHGATVTLGDAQGGGLRVEVVFPIPDNRRGLT